MRMETILYLGVLPVFAYFLGSVPWGLVLTRLFTNIDIRAQGSGNIGATNVRRTAGNVLGVLTLAGDVFKGAFPVFIAVDLAGKDGALPQIYLALVALAAFAGHLHPIYLKGKDGGKGVATALGCFLVLSPVSTLIGLLVFILLICMTSRVSAASMGALVVMPLAMWKAESSMILTGWAIVTGLWAIWRHHENIARLVSGKEPTVGRNRA